MGTTLTGTTPQDTYDSLIKVTDNGPISGTAKFLSDGLGNDSALALSTARVGVGTNTPAEKLDVNGAIAVRAATASFATASAVGMIDQPTSGITRLLSFGPDVSTLGSFQFYTTGANNTGGVSPMTITSAGNVGIGTSAPPQRLSLSANGNLSFQNTLGSTGTYGSIISYNDLVSTTTQATAIRFIRDVAAVGADGAITFETTAAERFRITNNGVTFNGDTAAANALDDYEEGTWTMGVSFGGASAGMTFLFNTGSYTKIGRQVTVNGWVYLTSKGSSTGNAKITGLPFTVGNSPSTFSTASLWFSNILFTNQFQAFADGNTTSIILEEITVLGVNTFLTNADFADNSQIMISLTYFV